MFEEELSTSRKPKLYLDTNVINMLCSKPLNKSIRSILNRYEILFSHPLLDEIISCPSQWQQAELANFMWRISNRRVLLTVGDIISLEVESLLHNKKIHRESYYDKDTICFDAWREARRGEIPQTTRAAIQEKIKTNKELVLRRLRKGRENWNPKFKAMEIMLQSWPEAYQFLSEERRFNDTLLGMMEAVNIFNRTNDKEAILGLDYKMLPATSIGIEFYTALRFIIDSQSRNRGGKPDAGDLYDMQHAFYVYLSDYFVTNDQRTYGILNDLIDTKNTQIFIGNDFFTP